MIASAIQAMSRTVIGAGLITPSSVGSEVQEQGPAASRNSDEA